MSVNFPGVYVNNRLTSSSPSSSEGFDPNTPISYIKFVDNITGKIYMVRVSNGKLTMSEVSN